MLYDIYMCNILFKYIPLVYMHVFLYMTHMMYDMDHYFDMLDSHIVKAIINLRLERD